MREPRKSLEQMLLDLRDGRYDLVALARDWIDVLSRSDDGVGLSQSELIRKSLVDIVSGDISEKDIENAIKKMRSMPVTASGENSSKDKKKDEKKDKK